MAPAIEHWQWTFGAVLLLVGILLYRHMIRKAQSYTLRVKNELEEYVGTPKGSGFTLPPISNHAVGGSRAA
jgi:hypothetical protein